MQETQKTWVSYLDQEDPLEQEMATHSRLLACKIPWTEEPDTTKQPSIHTHFCFCLCHSSSLLCSYVCFFFFPLLFSSFSMSKSYIYSREVHKEILIHFSFIQKFVIEELLCAKYLKHNNRSDKLPLPFTCMHCEVGVETNNKKANQVNSGCSEGKK